MKDMLLTALEGIILLAIPVLVAFAVKFLTDKSAQLRAATNNELLRRYIGEAERAVTTAVLATSQTYVDALKEGGLFDKDKQAEALKQAVFVAKAQLTEEAKQFIEDAYGDLYSYITSKIEAEIKGIEIAGLEHGVVEAIGFDVEATPT